ncbi:PAS domain-containing protein [Flagellimonas allohymeniacidonis]|uniref:PAS domain-containing protein n=1 Tax=Flagellimonas allohymeniacidonis TaxID=2517819 RepID=A0A4Q8QH31_9FLAO|nr:PAS domain-containing protein [Allomuricauda hymeniacidonis]TAI47709.1 PAS domain-containing protein [Allomuricauda hymeniacidonis]
MEKIRYYDEAISKFYRNQEINSYPLSSLDIYSQHFDKVCQSLQDISNLSDLAKKEKWEKELPFKNEILGKEHVVVVTDPQLNIVYASQNIYSMNGYRPEEILGKKPKMFQGEKTSMETARNISKAVRNLEPFEATITNYRKDGSTYNCWIQGAPVFDTRGKVVNFIAFEKEVA